MLITFASACFARDHQSSYKPASSKSSIMHRSAPFVGTAATSSGMLMSSSARDPYCPSLISPSMKDKGPQIQQKDQAFRAHFLKLSMMSLSDGPVFLFDSLSRDACTAHIGLKPICREQLQRCYRQALSEPLFSPYITTLLHSLRLKNFACTAELHACIDHACSFTKQAKFSRPLSPHRVVYLYLADCMGRSTVSE